MGLREDHDAIAASDWDDVRRPDRFDLVSRQYAFGTRNTYVPREDRDNLMLQYSRGVVDSARSYEDLLRDFQREIEDLRESDLVRSRELELVVGKCQELGIPLRFDDFCEIGFRTPKLMRHYGSRFARTVGFDIADFNVRVAREMGFDCRVADLNAERSPLPDAEFDLVVCYHVLEHTFDPVRALGHIVSSLRVGGLLHIETPIEPGTPRLRYGHLIALEAGDLPTMLDIVGMRLVAHSTATHTGGPEVERVTAIRVA